MTALEEEAWLRDVTAALGNPDIDWLWRRIDSLYDIVVSSQDPIELDFLRKRGASAYQEIQELYEKHRVAEAEARSHQVEREEERRRQAGKGASKGKGGKAKGQGKDKWYRSW
jgi:hypothetical protein